MRFSHNAEARRGVDGIWRMWERLHWTTKYGWSCHVDLETPGEVWVVTNMNRDPTKLIVTEGAKWRLQKENQTSANQ